MKIFSISREIAATVRRAAVGVAVAGFLLCAGALQASAQYADFTDKFEMNNDCWDENNDWSFDMESKIPIMGVTWKTHAFKYTGERLATGISTLDYVATFGSTGPVERGLKRVVLEPTITDYDRNISRLRGVRLLMAGNPGFSGATVIHPASMPANAGDPLLFEIAEPAEGMYYRFEVDFLSGGYRDCWFKVERLKFYDTSWNDVVSVIRDAEEGEPEWYTLQGVRVENPSRGVYVRRVGSRVEKVAL